MTKTFYPSSMHPPTDPPPSNASICSTPCPCSVSPVKPSVVSFSTPSSICLNSFSSHSLFCSSSHFFLALFLLCRPQLILLHGSLVLHLFVLSPSLWPLVQPPLISSTPVLPSRELVVKDNLLYSHAQLLGSNIVI